MAKCTSCSWLTGRLEKTISLRLSMETHILPSGDRETFDELMSAAETAGRAMLISHNQIYHPEEVLSDPVRDMFRSQGN